MHPRFCSLGTPEKLLIGVEEGLSRSMEGEYRLQQEQGVNQTEYSLPGQAMYIYKAFAAPLLCILSTHQRRKIMFTAEPAARCQIAVGFFQIIKKKKN